jgi:peptidase E
MSTQEVIDTAVREYVSAMDEATNKGDTTMTKLELDTSELLTLKDVLESDMEQTSWGGGETAYDDVSLMQYYLDRAKVLEKVKELIND